MKKLLSFIIVFLTIQPGLHATYPDKRSSLLDQTAWLARYAFDQYRAINNQIVFAKNKQELLKKIFCMDELSQFNAYHMKSASWMDGWTCGLFALKNAFTIEQVIGLAAPKIFNTTIQTCAAAHKINLQEGTYASQVATLAQSVGLKHVYILNIDKQNRLIPVEYKAHYYWDSGTKELSAKAEYDGAKATAYVTSPFRTPQAKMEQLAQEAMRQEIIKELQKLKLHLCTQTGPQVAHFVCQVPEENHWILVSVVIFPGQAPCYLLFDNLNKPIKQNSTRMRYLSHLKNIFG